LNFMKIISSLFIFFDDQFHWMTTTYVKRLIYLQSLAMNENGDS
jgi:hypothetical protein